MDIERDSLLLLSSSKNYKTLFVNMSRGREGSKLFVEQPTDEDPRSVI